MNILRTFTANKMAAKKVVVKLLIKGKLYSFVPQIRPADLVRKKVVKKTVKKRK